MEDVIKLLEEGAPVNWRNSSGWTSLHVACISSQRDDLEVMKVLLEYKANVNQQDNFGHTPLHHVCRYGHFDSMEILVATGQCDLG